MRLSLNLSPKCSQSKLQSSGIGGVDRPTDEFLNTLPKQQAADGKFYVQHLGKTYQVSE